MSDDDQKEQPAPVGYCPVGFRVGTYGKDNEPCLLADIYFRKDCKEDIKDYPFRSAEYYPTRQSITSIALLRTDPALDMGMVSYQGEPRYDYALPMPGMGMPGVGGTPTPAPMDPTGMPSAMAPDALLQQQVLQILQTCFPHLSAMNSKYAETLGAPMLPPQAPGGMPPPAAQPPAPAAPPPEGTGGDPMGDLGDEDLDGDGDLDAEPPPAPAKKKSKPAPKDDYMSTDTELVRYQQELSAANARIEALEKRDRVNTYKERLRQLHARHQFDLADEVTYVSDFTPEMFERHLTRVAKYPEREDPTRYSLIDAVADEGEAFGGHRPLDEDDVPQATVDKALHYMRTHNTNDYEAALAHVQGNGKK